MTKRVPHLFTGDSAMAARHRETDWSRTAIGEPRDWPSPLKTLVPIMLASNQPMFIVWGPARTLLYNDGYAQILDAKHPDAFARDFLDVWSELREDLVPIVDAAYRGEPVRMQDILLWMERRGYREETHFSFFYAPVRDESGDVAGFFCACTEITAQVMAERRLAESEARHRGVLANMDEAFTLLDADFNIVEINDEALRLIGLPREEVVGCNHWERFPGTHDSELGRMYRRALAERRPNRPEHEHRFEDGRERWFEVRAVPVGTGLAVLFRDVTEQRRLAQDAATASERVQLALDAGAIVGTWVWRIPEDIFVADERFARSFGLDPLDCQRGLPLEHAVRAIHPDDQARVETAIADALARGSTYRAQYRVRVDGSYRWVEANGRVELDGEGRPLRFPGVLLDIEHRRTTELERDRAMALLETFIEAVPGVVYAKDRDGRFIVGNRGTAELLGMPPAGFLGRTDADVLADKAQARALMEADRRIMESGVAAQIEEPVRLPDGTPAIWWSTKAPLRDARGEVVGLIGSSIDITDRKRIEDALRVSEQRSALAIEVAQLGAWQLDTRTGRVTLDDRCRELCGIPQDAAGLGLDDILARVHPDDLERVRASLREAATPGGAEAYSEEFRWRHPDGRVVWTASRGVLLYDPARRDAPTTMMSSLIDVTERRQMLEALKETDRRKDEFLAMLAHELRNPLAPISTASQMLRLSNGEARRVAQASEIIDRQIRHLTRLVDDLLDVSRVTRGLVELEHAPVDIQAVVAAAVEQARPLVEARRHALRTSFDTGAARLQGDFHRLVQVVANLLNNAAKYTPQGGAIDVRVTRTDGRVLVEVADNGLGIDPGLLPRVFHLFTQGERTPDRAQGGLGIGLALVRSMVQLHGGEVRAESDGPHRGSRFTVVLPGLVARDAPSQAATEPTRAVSLRNVLIVDDNTDAATTLADVLGLLGHRAGVASSASEALRLALDEGAWDTFILDIGLPDMTGYELAERLRAIPAHASARYIALTGYGQAHDRVISRAAGFAHHLVKPADMARLVEALDAQVD